MGRYLSLLASLLIATSAAAETGYDAWLRYSPITDAAVRDSYRGLPQVIVNLDRTPIAASAEKELIRGTVGMLGRKLSSAPQLENDAAIVLGTAESARKVLSDAGAQAEFGDLDSEGFLIKSVDIRGKRSLIIIGEAIAACYTALSRCCE